MTTVDVIIADKEFIINVDGQSVTGYINDTTRFNEIIDKCKTYFDLLSSSLDEDYYSSNIDAIIILKLFKSTPKIGFDEGFTVELNENEQNMVKIDPYKYYLKISRHFSRDLVESISYTSDDIQNDGTLIYTIPGLFYLANDFYQKYMRDISEVNEKYYNTVSHEYKKNSFLLDKLIEDDDNSYHYLRTKNRLSFINKDQIERKMFNNDFLRRTLFYLCLIIFVAFLSQFGFSLFISNTICLLIFVSWVIHSFIMYHNFNTRHNLQFRMKVYNGQVPDLAKNNIRYKNTDRCNDDDDDKDDDKPRGKC